MSKLMRRAVAALALLATLCGSAAADLTFEFLPKNPGWTAYGDGTRDAAGAVDSAGIVASAPR
jgi:ABC-type sugar transport system substrate-binding protein